MKYAIAVIVSALVSNSIAAKSFKPADVLTDEEAGYNQEVYDACMEGEDASALDCSERSELQEAK